MIKKRTSYAFLMEMLWVCGFFALASCIFVLAFVKADRLSKRAENLNHAVLTAENALETAFAEFGGEIGGETVLQVTDYAFDRTWKPCEGEAPEAAFLLEVSSQVKDGLLCVTADVSERIGGVKETLYTLSGSRACLAAERGNP